MNKKIILIVVLLALVLIFGIVLLIYLKRTPSVRTVEIDPQVSLVSDEEAISPTFSLDGSALWYFNAQGRLYRLAGSEKNEFPLPNFPYRPLIKSVWSPAGQDFLALGTTSTGQSYFYYDNAQSKYFPLADNVLALDWLPDGKRIALVWKSADAATQQLVVSDADGSGYRTVTQLPWPEFAISANPQSYEALLVSTRPDTDTNNIYLFNLDNGQYQTLVSGKKSLAAKWLDEKRFIYSAYTDGTTKTFLYDLDSMESKDLGVNTSFNKIAKDDSNNVYAAVPKTGSGDMIVKVDLDNLDQITYFDPSETIRVSDLYFMNNTVYFVNQEDGKFYSVK